MRLLPKRIETLSWDIAYYTIVVVYQIGRFRRPSAILKANYGIDHGGFAFASKYKIQEYVGHQHFPETIFIPAELPDEEKTDSINTFVARHGYPIILKPDSGYVGKGVCKIDSPEQLVSALDHLKVDYLAQAFVPGEIEFGLFYVRLAGKIYIPSINQKFYPTIVQDGEETISYIGSNTLGSRFIDVSEFATSALVDSLEEMFATAPGLNFGRLDVKSPSVEVFQAGEFTTIEVNGVASLPTNMMDERKTFFELFDIIHRHAALLVSVAKEHTRQEMQVLPLLSFIQKNRRLMRTVERQHQEVSTTALT